MACPVVHSEGLSCHSVVLIKNVECFWYLAWVICSLILFLGLTVILFVIDCVEERCVHWDSVKILSIGYLCESFYSLWLWVTMIVCDSRFFTVWGYWRILHICCLYESWYPLQSLFTINVCESSFSLLVVIGGFYTFVVRTRISSGWFCSCL